MDPWEEVDSIDTGYWSSASSVGSNDSMEVHVGSDQEIQVINLLGSFVFRPLPVTKVKY